MKRSLAFAVVLAFFASQLIAQDNPAQAPPPPNPYQSTLDHLRSLTLLAENDWKFHADVAHPEDPSLNDSDWQTVKVKDKWSDGNRVLRRTIQVPEKLNGYGVQGGRLKLDLNFSSWAPMTITVFANGSVIYRGDEEMQQPITLAENAQPGQKFLVAVRVDCDNVETSLQRSDLLLTPPASRPDPTLVRLEIEAAQPMINAYPDSKSEHQRQLEAAVKAINFGVLDGGDQAGFDTSLRQAQTNLAALNPWLKQFTIRAIGNSHIDMAWLWPWTETVEVVRNTFRSALDLTREYPDFIFTMSSVRTYAWMQEKYPDMFREIQQRVKEGRWEVIGGMWVEPDLNMPAGESLVRQILVGKRYFQKNFGVDVKIGWNPDSFGYNWQLPQIYKKSGIDYFVTSKLLWATDYTRFPYRLFWWEAPDGSRLLTYFPHEYANNIDPPNMAKELSFYSPLIYGDTTAQHPEIMYLYGVGDHGGGPTRAMLDTAEEFKKPDVVFPKLEFSTATAFFDDVQKTLPNLKVPTWKDELYFEYHRGVMTTQAETKRRIRQTEETLLNAEKFSSISALYGRTYPYGTLKSSWERLLFDHFHDIMPGSGIATNYVDAAQNLEDVRRAGNDVIRGALHDIAARVNTNGPGVPVMLFNSLSWPRNEVIEIEAQLPAPAKQLEVTDATGKPVDSQLLSIDPQTNRARLLIAASVPSLGYSTYFVKSATTAATPRTSLKAAADMLENEFIRVKIDPESGCMTSLFNKRSNLESLAPSQTETGGPKDRTCGNLLQTFVDKPKKWDAWNIDADFENQHTDLDHADEVKLVENGPLRAVIRVKNHFQNSTFIRDITLYAGVARVDVFTQADWHEKHILLKVAFPVSVHSDKATFEIPYGSIERPTTRNTPAEKAKFEVPALHWADLSDAQHGFSLLNDCKYGYDAKGNVLRLSLLRSPDWPDPHADEGRHLFTYSLYPHGNTWREAQTVRRGDELNYPLESIAAEKHSGSLPPSQSFLQSQSDNIVVTALKRSEDGNSLIVRFYEWAGREGDVRLELPSGAQSASETNLMEQPGGSLPLAGGVVTVRTKPYEIKTIKVDFASIAPAEVDTFTK